MNLAERKKAKYLFGVHIQREVGRKIYRNSIHHIKIKDWVMPVNMLTSCAAIWEGLLLSAPNP